MTSETPKGYDDIGESIAQAVLEGAMTRTLADELASLSGYSTHFCGKWLAYYRERHAKELEALERRAALSSGRIEDLRRRSRAIRQKLLDG